MRFYYASILRDSKACLAAGPFKSRTEALAIIERVKEEASKVDPMTHFDLFGTLKAPEGYMHPGKLNKRGVLYLDGHRKDLDTRIAAVLVAIRGAVNLIDSKAADLQEN